LVITARDEKFLMSLPGSTLQQDIQIQVFKPNNNLRISKCQRD
jgi:hypothetical protein